jgi:hypothetical protein
MATRMQQRRGTAAQWTASDPILNIGEIGFESDNNKFKIGDGVNHWADLPYFLDEDTIGTSLSGYLEDTLLGANNGVAQLNSSGKLVSTQIPNVDEITQDAINTALVAGTGLDKTYDDNGNTITLDIDSTVATLTGTQTLTNKTLTSPVVNTPTGITKSDVGLANVDDTTDANKPVSTATQTALDLKAPLASPTFTGTVTLPANTISQSMMGDDSVGTNEIGGLAVTTGKLADGAVTSLKIADDTIVDADINSAAAIATSKISGLDTALGLKAPLDSPTFTTTVKLPSSVEGPTSSTSVNMFFGSGAANLTFGGGQTTGNLTIGGGTQRTTGVIGIGTGATTTGTKTINVGTGSTGGTTAITVGSSSGATSNITLNGTVTAANNLVVTGDLTVNGTTTTINSTTLAVDDKNIIIGDVETPTDTTADGGGITLKGATDKTFNWVDATDAWTSSEHINLASGKTLKYNGTDLVAAQSGNSGKYLTTDGTTTSWGTVSGYSAPTLGSTSIASGATVTTVAGLTKITSAAHVSLDASDYEQDIVLMNIMGAY